MLANKFHLNRLSTIFLFGCDNLPEKTLFDCGESENTNCKINFLKSCRFDNLVNLLSKYLKLYTHQSHFQKGQNRSPSIRGQILSEQKDIYSDNNDRQA